MDTHYNNTLDQIWILLSYHIATDLAININEKSLASYLQLVQGDNAMVTPKLRLATDGAVDSYMYIGL